MVAIARRYTVVLAPDPDEGGYVVSVPALPGCVTEGDTVEEALENAKDLVRLYIEDLEAHGEPVPQETQQPTFATIDI
jgi:predicted RNase H-like HicB family nuclease